MKNVWNMEDVKAIVKEVEIATGEKLGLEVKVNGRLKRALARCLTKVINGKHIPSRLEFGNIILNVSDHEIFKQIVLHEIAHAIANKRYQDNCNHDTRFVKVCQEIGCTNTGAYCSAEYSNALQQAYNKINNAKQQTTKATTKQPYEEQPTTKYSVVCTDCGKTYHYKKMCPTLKELEYCRCGRCNRKSLKLIQNW